MNDLQSNRYLLKSNSYIIDLHEVDFITWKENDKKADTYWAKLHVGSKEARYVCEGKEELKELLMAWADIKGTHIDIDYDDIIEEW